MKKNMNKNTRLYRSTIVLAQFALLALLSGQAFSAAATPAGSKPNIVIIMADDMGYGDLSVQGHPLIRTPNIDQLANEGQRWTSFYASAPKCNPSRMALMTGRLPIRFRGDGLNGTGSIPDEELSLGELLKGEGYATAYIGKWGIGDNRLLFKTKGSHPNEQGFDYFLGTIHSNDGLREGIRRTYENIKNSTSKDFIVKLFKQRQIIEDPIYQPLITRRFTEESLEWIGAHKDKPFFLCLGYMMPHVPLFASPEFKGRSRAGLYGDVIEEIDWSVGEIVKALEEAGVGKETLVLFTSDNGPWLTYYDLGGSPGPLRDGKMTAWEGGFRVPGIFWWPGKIKPAVIDGIGCNVDLVATVSSLVGFDLPQDRVFDSIDLSPTLLNGSPSPRNEWFYYGQPGNLWAYRLGNHKLVFESWESLGTEKERGWRGLDNRQKHDPALLFDLATDISERRDIAAEQPRVVEAIREAVSRHQQSLGASQP